MLKPPYPPASVTLEAGPGIAIDGLEITVDTTNADTLAGIDDNDTFLVGDSADDDTTKTVTADLVKDYVLDGLSAGDGIDITSGVVSVDVTNADTLAGIVDADLFLVGDSADANATKKVSADIVKAYMAGSSGGWTLETTVNPPAGSSNQDITIPVCNDFMLIGYGVAGVSKLCGTGLTIYLENASGLSTGRTITLGVAIGGVAIQILNLNGEQNIIEYAAQGDTSNSVPVIGTEADSFSSVVSSSSTIDNIRLGAAWVANGTLELWTR